jgi:hypothetical protein
MTLSRGAIMSEHTTRLQLPFLAAGQAQKHITVNESLLRLDALAQLATVSATTAAQPGAPADGDVYILPSGKSGADWAAMANGALAYYRDGVWEEIAPREGWLAHAADGDRFYVHSGSGWVELGAALGALRTICHSAVASALTGATTEAILASIAIPGGAMGPNGVLRVTTEWSYTNSANTKTLRTRLGSGLSGTVFDLIAPTTNAFQRRQCDIKNRNANNAQMAPPSAYIAGFGTSTGAVLTGAVDTSAAQTLAITGQLTNAGETITLESYRVELAYRA